MSTGQYVGIAVPFTVEEVLMLNAFAKARGSSIAQLIRARVFEPRNDLPDSADIDGDDEDLTSLMARMEGLRIRSRRGNFNAR